MTDIITLSIKLSTTEGWLTSNAYIQYKTGIWMNNGPASTQHMQKELTRKRNICYCQSIV